jgi:ubiquinone/menaquinone biosynthesis C-methylase UbiE
LNNIEFILTDCAIGIQNESIDSIIFYDILHMIKDPVRNLQEFHRILKKEGILTMSNHHMKEKDILQTMTAGDLFKLKFKSGKIYNFEKK